ncbi:MAG: TFIIB-type zinc finger domain-containing protein [Bacteroidales bacterium]|nr:TFIIB-type zinc finger domain-containing protein [Bacteroidales bacterium]
MKALVCELCGSNDVVKQDGLYVCQNCGTKYTVEEAKKMMIEGTVDVQGTVKVDISEELKNLYEIARRAKDTDNSENALKYYDMILVKDPSSWEANFYVVYFRAMSCKIAEIRSAATSVSNCLNTVFELVKSTIKDFDQQTKIVSEIYSRCLIIANMLSGAAESHYNGIDVSIRSNYVQEYVNNAAASADIMYILGNVLEKSFEGKFGVVSANAWEDGIKIHNSYLKYLQDKDANIKIMTSYGERIKKYNSSYNLPAFKTSNGCYVATAIYGSYNCPEVWTLRRFRDNTLDTTWYGRAFIKTYYTISPTLVKWFGETRWFKKMWRKPLDRMVSSLQRKGVESTPYQDKY